MVPRILPFVPFVPFVPQLVPFVTICTTIVPNQKKEKSKY
jgi:hypothetical protein